MIAHGRDPNAGPIRVGDAADRRAGRHQAGIVDLHERGREAADLGNARRVEPQRPNVAGPAVEAVHELARRRLLHQHELNADARRKGANDLDPHTARLPGCGILAVLRREQPDPERAGANEIGDPRVGAALRDMPR